eukprot:COSAG05_NODE_2591_length_2863_cov_2.560781_1_plen_136_part_00
MLSPLLLLLLLARAIAQSGEIVCRGGEGVDCRICNCVRVRVYDPCDPPTTASGVWSEWGGCGPECGGKGIALSTTILPVPETGCRSGATPLLAQDWVDLPNMPTPSGGTGNRRVLMSQSTKATVAEHTDSVAKLL